MKRCGREDCPFYERGIAVADRIPVTAWNGVLIVGECPSREEARRGTPFVGMPGHLLAAILKTCNTSLEATHTTSAIRCAMTMGARPADSVMEQARACCAEAMLIDNILDLRPKVILTLGSSALLSVTELKGVEKFRGATTRQTFADKEELFEVLVVSTIHPAALLHTTEKHPWLDLFGADVQKAVRLAAGQDQIYAPTVRAFSYDLVRQILSSSEVIALDLETTGIDIRECHITTVGLSSVCLDPTTDAEDVFTVSIPCPDLRKKYRTKEWEKTWRLLRTTLLNPKRSWVFHNMAFDVPVLERELKLTVAGACHDTLLEHHAVYPKAPHDLEAVATQFFCVEPWKSYYAKRFINVGDEAIPELLYYNGADTEMTLELHRILGHEMSREQLAGVYENDREITRYAMDWERIGVGIDDEVRLELHDQFRVEIDDLLIRLRDQAGDARFNPNSSPQLQAILVDVFQLIPKKVTKTGQLSTDAASLFDFRDHPFVELLQKYRTKSKLFSTYIDGLAKKVGTDGRLHPRWNKTATPSGRFGTKPAVQNWPDAMRRMLIPHRGRKIISADYSALELRISVTLAGEEDLIEAFIAGQDIHAMFAETYFSDAWGRALPDQRKVLRKHAKPITFGDIYRAGPRTLFENVREEVPGITLEEVTIMQARKRNKYQRLNEYAAYVTEIANRTLELRTPWLGRRRRWPLGGAIDTETTNHPIQGGASDIVDEATKRWIRRLKETGKYHTEVWPMLQLHDDLRAEVRWDCAEEALETLMECMRCTKQVKSPITGRTYDMKFEVEGKIGVNHLDLKEMP
jgi:DNA polymerase-1